MTELRAPATLYLGVGVADAAEVQDLIALAEGALKAADIADSSLVSIATIDTRRSHPAIIALALHHGLSVCSFRAEVLEAETPRLLNPSDEVFARTGCHGVAEAAALASAGPTGRLVVGKMKSRQATVAVAVAWRNILTGW
jgi:cobalamin biosynthesis protein CbiG